MLIACSGSPEQGAQRRTATETDEAVEWAASRRTDIADSDSPAAGNGGAQVPDAERFPCSVFSHAEAEELLGNAVEPASYALEQIEAGDQAVDAETCSWLSFAEGANEISIQISHGEPFTGDDVECSVLDPPWAKRAAEAELIASEGDQPSEGAQPDATETEPVADGDLSMTFDDGGLGAEAPDPADEPAVVEIDGLGYGAWWRSDEVVGLGNLLVCDQRARVVVEVSVGNPALNARDAAVELARRALAGTADGG